MNSAAGHACSMNWKFMNTFCVSTGEPVGCDGWNTDSPLAEDANTEWHNSSRREKTKLSNSYYITQNYLFA